MAILKRNPHEKIVIDLDGPDGNVFCLMKYASEFCKQLEWDVKPIHKAMMSGDYENAIKVFDDKFGTVCDLIRR